MPVADFAHNVQMPFFSATTRAPAPTPAQSAAASTTPKNGDAPKTDSKSLFDDLLDIVNPLQHIPVVSTLYRKLTGDTIQPFEQLAGDTLYGGVVGFAGSLADTAFAQIAGKDVSDTLMAMFDSKDTQVAQAAPAATYLVTPSAQTDVATAAPPASALTPGSEALMASMKQNGVDADLALRASFAYRQAMAQADAP